MQRTKAHINIPGIETILKFSEDKNRLKLDEFAHSFGDQVYIPGISIPDHDFLSLPFNVPIVGDNEPVGVSVLWPRRASNPVVQQVEFVGMLPAEEVTIGLPKERELFEEPSLEEEAVDQAFDDFSEDGGFLNVRVDVLEVGNEHEGYGQAYDGKAEFFIYDDIEEFEMINDLINEGIFNALSLITAIKLGVDIRKYL